MEWLITFRKTLDVVAHDKMAATCIKQKSNYKFGEHGSKIYKHIYSYLCKLLFLDYCLQNLVYIYTSKYQPSPHITCFQHTSLEGHTHWSLDRGNGTEKVIRKNKNYTYLKIWIKYSSIKFFWLLSSTLQIKKK